MKLTLRWRFALILSLSLLAWTAADGQFTPTADSYTSTSAPTINYGNAATLNIGGAREVAYIQFDLSAIPEGYTGANLAQATLKLYLNSVATAGSFNVDYVDGTWSEKTITAALSPALGTTIASNISVEKTQAGDYIDINVTSAVAAWLSGSQANDGIALVANGTFYATVDSKENTGTSHPPELDIVFLGNGAEGPAGIVNMGTWVSTTAYQVNNSVGYNGSSWIALVANTNSAPGGGGGLMGCGAFNLGAGNGGGGGAYTRSILTVTPGATYSVNVGTGGTVDVPGGNTSFTDASSDVLALAGGGVEGEDGCEEDACVYTRTESGLDYFGFRHYASSLGRFMKPDEPFADQDEANPQSWNLYSYVRNNPLRYTDPMGNACVSDGNGGWKDDNSGGETCAQVNAANQNAQPSVTVILFIATTPLRWAAS